MIKKFGPLITKQTTNMWLPISPEEKLAIMLRYEEKLAIMLRYLATGETFQSLMYQFTELQLLNLYLKFAKQYVTV